jgi:transposase
MSEISTVGLDLAKNVFQVHGADDTGRAVLRKKLRRAQVLDFSASCRLALSRWKPAAALISGAARSASWATKCG